ncbi:MAG: alpha/beta fold hydrolase [Anaerolineales bacterium]
MHKGMRDSIRWGLVTALGLSLVTAPLVWATHGRRFGTVAIPAEGYVLAGYLSEAEGPSAAWVVFVHGNRAEGQAHLLYQRIVSHLPSNASVLAIDMRGFGNSSAEGLESADRILDRTGDIEAAVEYLRAEYGVCEEEIVLMGHSLGALQVLRAGQSRPYRAVISIGPGDFRASLADSASRRAYAAKLSAAMGIRVPESSIAEEGQGFVPEELFRPSPQSPTVLVFGAFELPDSLRRAEVEIPEECSPMVRWETVPISDHMYGTEGEFLPPVVRLTTSWVPVGLLLWSIRQHIPRDPA